MNVLSYGKEGYPVKLLQYALERAGMEVGNPDGIFGRRTLKALQRFQRDKGLSADGIAGKLTWAALYPYICGYTLHRIVLGDSVLRLADRFSVSVNALETANPTCDLTALPVGETMVVPLDLNVVTDRIPYSAVLCELILKGLSVRYPFLKTQEIGRSVMGRRILSVSIGKGKKQIGYTAAHHADEWISVPVLLRFLEDYAAACSNGGSIGGIPASKLYETATLKMVPLVNPDGVDLVTGALDPGDSFYAQAAALAAHYPSIPFPNGWKSNISGIDLDLQYPAGWEIARRIRFNQGITRPGPMGYVGDRPLSAPESKAIADWTKENDFSLTLSCHAPGRTIRWISSEETLPEAEAIGLAISESSGFVPENTPFLNTHAGYMDWFVMNWRRPGFTVEAGMGEPPLPLSQLEEIYGANLPVLVRGIALST